ncbi:hypothetical protein DRO32_05355 [Candidatus Bathyarchaeota archaeon]|nr:MAG: hypothetical protein DRO32_05355 [Candidatus Bathyarchaeota archaeon]
MPKLSGPRPCDPTCKFFRCAQRALVIIGGKPWCRLANDVCDVARCGYAICVRRRLLPGGICGETVKRRTSEVGPESVEAIKVSPRILKKLGEDEIVY